MCPKPVAELPEARPANGAAERLLESAIKLFAEKGYSATSIREIIEDAGVTRPVLYYYFKSKADLFSRVVEGQFAAACDEIQDIIDSISGCRARLEALILRTFESAENSPELVGVLLQFFFTASVEHAGLDKERLADERFELIARIMQEGIDSGELTENDPKFLAQAFASMMDMQIMTRSVRSSTVLLPEMGERLVDLFMSGAEAGS